MSKYPDQHSVHQLLTELLGRAVQLKVLGPGTFPCKPTTVVGRYENDDHELVAVSLSDHQMAVYSGSALTMLQPSAARESVDKGVLNEESLESYEEVLNILAQVFNFPGKEHLRLAGVSRCDGDEHSDQQDILPILEKPDWRLDCEVTITGYGPGRLTICMKNH